MFWVLSVRWRCWARSGLCWPKINAVYSAMFLAMTMIILAVFCLAQDAVLVSIQVVVYTGAVMMLFLMRC